MLEIDEIPRLIQRHCGGWLALSPADSDLQIGVPADSREVAVEKYRATVARCRNLLAESDHQHRALSPH